MEERSIVKALLIEPLEAPVEVSSPSAYLEASAGGAEWFLSLSSITLSDSNAEQLLGIV